MLSAVGRVLRLASIAICLIVVASFVVFATDQTKEASGHQAAELGSAPGTVVTPAGEARPLPAPHKSSLHKTLDEVSEKLTSPFKGIVSNSSSEWAKRSFLLIAALLVYGFGLGFLARTVRVRA